MTSEEHALMGKQNALVRTSVPFQPHICSPCSQLHNVMQRKAFELCLIEKRKVVVVK